MSPPTEQLIRDYLNRLSVAARGQLVPDDRRALVDRTREFIERKTGFGGPPTAVEVASLLSGLGDPAGLVSQERQRLATLRGEALEPVSRGRLARALRGGQGKVRGASWHWPVQPGSRADLQLTLIDSGADAGRGATAGATASRQTTRAGTAETAGQAVNPDDHDSDAAGIARPRWPALTSGVAADGFGHDSAGQQDTAQRGAGYQETVHQDLDHSGPGTGQPALHANGAAAVTGPMPAGATRLSIWQLATSAVPQPSRTRQRLGRLAGWSRRNKLETVAIVLLGLGGVIFPPVWLLGVAVALPSRLWDYRDKWVGLALPVLLTVIGTVIGLAVGSRISLDHGMHESWVFAVGVSRATALLSACYLAWRAARGPRPPAVPPWDKPRRVA